MLKKYSGWKSNVVAEGYVDSSIEMKKNISMQILGNSNRDLSNKKTLENRENCTVTSVQLKSSKTNSVHNLVSMQSSSIPDSNSHLAQTVLQKDVSGINLPNNKLLNCVFNIYNK